MKNLALHLFAVLVFVGTLFVMTTGAVVTNSRATANPPESLPGALTQPGHRYAAEAAGILIIILGVWAAATDKPLRPLAFTALAASVVQIGLGHGAAGSAPGLSLLHASLAPGLLASLAALAWMTSPMGRREPVLMPDKGWPPMRGLATTTHAFVVLQVILGASFRHGALGVMWHILGALVVVVLLLTLVICLTQTPGDALLKPAGITLLVIASVQVFLGLTVVSMSTRAMATTAGAIFSAAHVALGALTLAVSVVVWIEARRSLRRQA
jgi:heme A synthase